MPQLDTTYFISQIFWLTILFAVFYIVVRFLIVPKLNLILSARANITNDSESFVNIVELEITQMKIDAKKKAEATDALIKRLEDEAAAKYDLYSKDLLFKLQKKLDKDLGDATKEAEKLIMKNLQSEEMNHLVVASSKNMIFQLTNSEISIQELKNLMK